MKLSFFNINYHHAFPFSFRFPSSPITTSEPPPRSIRMDSSPFSTQRQLDKIVVVMGATGCGKTTLSIDLATTFQSEIINSDKIQLYKGLDITTNKITFQDRLHIPHHLLGEFDPDYSDLSPSDFRLHASLAISDIVSRQKLPLLVGGSNTYMHALLVDRYNPELNVFRESGCPLSQSVISTKLRYKCCFIWVDVSLPLLCDYLCERVDEMLESGMFEELSEYYGSEKPKRQPGLRKSIGIAEFEGYFKKYPPGYEGEWNWARRGVYEEAVRMIKENTCELARRQRGKIMRLKTGGWELHRVDGSEAIREAMKVKREENGGECYCRNDKNIRKKKRKKRKWKGIWERDVMKPSIKIVSDFLDGYKLLSSI